MRSIINAGLKSMLNDQYLLKAKNAKASDKAAIDD